MTISGIIGTSWPWNIFPVWVENDDAIYDSIQRIIFTVLGERKMNSLFGSDTISVVFENRGEILAALARREISLALAQHLPVVSVLNIDVIEPEQDTDPVDVIVYYEYQGVREKAALSVPSGV